MAGPYYVDDGGDGTTEDSWATADTSLKDLNAEYAGFGNGVIVYIGHDHVCQATHSAKLEVVSPASGAPVIFISATQGSTPPVYQASTTDQIDTTEGAYDIHFNGSTALYGICMKSGKDILFDADINETFVAYGCTFKPASGKGLKQVTNTQMRLVDCVIDLSQDAAPVNAHIFVNSGSTFRAEIIGCSFSNASNRNGTSRLVEELVGGANYFFSSCDFSSLSDEIDIAGFTQSGKLFASNCKTAATWTPIVSNQYGYGDGKITFINCGPTDDPSMMLIRDAYGTITSYSTICRTGGASFEGTSTSWLIDTSSTTYAQKSESQPFVTPWIYGYIPSAGSKTFDLYITNDTADFTDAEVWLEVEYLGTANVAQSSLATDKRATITATAVAQDDDTTSTWTGTGPAFTYKQKLSVTATVGEEGQFRARVCVGVASISAARNFFIDPKVTVS